MYPIVISVTEKYSNRSRKFCLRIDCFDKTDSKNICINRFGTRILVKKIEFVNFSGRVIITHGTITNNPTGVIEVVTPVGLFIPYSKYIVLIPYNNPTGMLENMKQIFMLHPLHILNIYILILYMNDRKDVLFVYHLSISDFNDLFARPRISSKMEIFSDF